MGNVENKDVVIIGGGIVGLATAYQLLKSLPGHSLSVLEKEPKLAMHQTGHNSGVLHSGIYYKPGSLKAINCRKGKAEMERFCEEEEIPFELCGKVIVAIDQEERGRLKNIYERGLENGVSCELIDQFRLKELEPHAAGVEAIHVPEAGIVDYVAVCERLAQRVHEMGGEFVGDAKVEKIVQRNNRVVLESHQGSYEAKVVINCAGLYSDVIARKSGVDPKAKIIPFRGEYFDLDPDAAGLVNNLIYPVPDPSFPFLGVHFTRMIGGGVECGPNAVLAFAREGYSKLNINPAELVETLSYPGFVRMASKYWQMGLSEMWRSFSKAAFVKALQRLLPELESYQISSAPAGVRAQAIGDDGSLIDDFLIVPHERVINVCNAPSPAATASLSIGARIVDEAIERLR